MVAPLAVNQNNLGSLVVTRSYSWLDQCIRAWGSEWQAPDHKIYVFSNESAKDSTDLTSNGIYNGGAV